MENDDKSIIKPDDSSLEAPDTTETTPAGAPPSDNGAVLAVTQAPDGSEPTPGAPKPKGGRKLFGRLNIYLLLFVLALILGGIVVVVAVVVNNHNQPVIKTQSLSNDVLKQLATSDVTVGEPKQVLNVQSNAVFAGKVLINDSLEVAGGLQVGSGLTLPGISVSGISNFGQVQVGKDLNIAGNTAIQGQLSVQNSLSVAGGATFGGPLSAPQITANSLQVNGDLNLTHHLTMGGSTPGRSNGGALGSGGTTALNGSDSAGSININTGSGAGPGCFITVNFTQRFNATPHVLITPVGSAAAGLQYYVNRSTSSFSVCTVSTPPANASFGFDYFVLD